MEMVRCPFCQGPNTTVIVPFGSRLLTEQWWCHTCQSAFEWVPSTGPWEGRHD